MSQRTHTQTFTEGINQRLSPQRTRGFVRLQNARLSALGNTAEIKRIEGYEVVGGSVPSGTVLDTLILGNDLFLLAQNGDTLTVQIRDLTDVNFASIATYNINNYTGNTPNFVLMNDAVFISQANKMINNINGTYYFNDIRPLAPVPVGITKQINSADESVQPDENIIKSVQITYVTESGLNLSKTIEYNLFDDNRVNQRTGSLDYTVKLTTNIPGYESQTQSFTYTATNTSGVESGSFNIVLPTKLVTYKCKLQVVLDNFPEYNHTKEFLLVAAGTPELTVTGTVTTPPYLIGTSPVAYLDIDISGEVYYGTTVDITVTVWESFARIQQVEQVSYPGIASTPRVLKIQVGGDPKNLARYFSQTHRTTVGWLAFTTDYIIDVDMNVTGLSGGDYEASKTLVLYVEKNPDANTVVVRT